MENFGLLHIGTYNQNKVPDITEPHAIVHNDGKAYLYAINQDDLDAFAQWVIVNFDSEEENERNGNTFWVA